MFEKLHKEWAQFRAAKPGQRFQERFERRKAGGASPLKTAFYMGAGVVAIAIGIFMLVAPGPGLIGIALGIGLIAQESLTIAKMLDSAELALRPRAQATIRAWDKASDGARLTVKMIALIVAGSVLLVSYQIFIS